MSAGYPPKKGAAYSFTLGLIDQSNTKLLKLDPTLAAGDFKISKDGGAYANLANLPTVAQAGHAQVAISLSAAEMNADDISIECIDAAGDEWCSQFIAIKTSAGQINDLTSLDSSAAARFHAWELAILGK